MLRDLVYNFVLSVTVLVSRIRQESYYSRSLDSSGNLSLMYGAGAGDPLREDLASLRHILLELFNVLVIYGFCLISAELAYLSSSHAAASLVIHALSPFLKNLKNPFLERDVVVLKRLKSFRNAHISVGAVILLPCRS